MQFIMDDMICCICHEEVNDNARTLCNHLICKGCSTQFRNTFCPICRTDPVRNHYLDNTFHSTISKMEQDDKEQNEKFVSWTDFTRLNSRNRNLTFLSFISFNEEDSLIFKKKDLN